MVRIDSIVVGAVSTNCYFLINDALQEALIIDPGDNAGAICEYIKKEGVKPAAIMLTHGHFDHILAVPELRETFDIPVYALDAEKQVLNSPSMNLSGRMMRSKCVLDADHYCRDGEELVLAGIPMRVLATPGHTPGGCCYYVKEQGIVFCGDTLFSGSIGRTDFEGGSYAQLCSSVKEKLFTLPERTTCYPGHGEPTNIGYERKHNPYVR